MRRRPVNARLSGDILLVSAAPGKSANTAAQSLARLRRAVFSHVAITLEPTTIIHATPDKGVHLLSVNDFLKQVDRTSLRVLRSVDVDQNPALQRELRDALAFFLEQRYNFRFFARVGERSSYCSELAAKAYQRIGHPLGGRRPRNTLPVDLGMLGAQPRKWLDVTSLYTDANPTPDVVDSIVPGLSRFFEDSGRVLEEAGDLSRHREVMMHDVVKEQQDALKTLDAINDLLGLPRTKIKQQREYWDAPRRNPKKNR